MTISTAPSWVDRYLSSAVRLPVIHGAALSSNSRGQRSPIPLARLPWPWVWALTSPGCSSRRAAVISTASAGAGEPGGPISRIVSSSIRMSAGSAVPAAMSSTRPPRRIVWVMLSSPQSVRHDKPMRARSRAMPNVIVERHEAVLEIILNRPDVLNAVDRDTIAALAAAAAEAAEDKAARAVLLRGAGTHFCAGGDIGMFAELIRLPAEERRKVVFHTVDA